MTSTQTLMPVDYYRLPFCSPAGGPKRENENLGEFLAGDRIENSPYVLKMKTDMYCEQVCIANLGRAESAGVSPNKVVKAIRKNYHNNWIVDNLPAASIIEDKETVTTRYWQGFPIGFVSEQDSKAYINNHVNIVIEYHPVESLPGKFRVVRFTVEPFSIRHQFEKLVKEDILDDSLLPRVADIRNPIDSCNPTFSKKEHTKFEMISVSQEASDFVLFTYDVIWNENLEVKWATRWDIYLSMGNTVRAKVHWLSIANSLVIVFVLSAMTVAILERKLNCDINRYNKVAQDEESRAEELEEYGWKLVPVESPGEELEQHGWKSVHADVFRPPSFSPMILAVACGTGAQLLFTTLFTIIFAMLGFMNPSRRGHLLMGELCLYVVMGSVNGYVTTRLYRMFKGTEWQLAATIAAIGFPGFAFFIFFIMNIVAFANGSTYAVPFSIMLILLVLWFGVSTPLVYLGAYFGYKQDAIVYPVSTSSIPRQIPDQPWFMGIPFTLAIGGILPFGSCFVELFYIMSSVWMEYYYYVFGFLFLVFVILILTCAEITVLLTYSQLCKEDYHWWWRSFCNGGSTAIYVFLYSFVYFKELEVNSLATSVLYFGYMALASCALFAMMGFIGLSSSLWFNKTMFSTMTNV